LPSAFPSSTCEGKIDDVEGKVDSIEGKIDDVEGMVIGIEGKIGDMEDKMDNMDGVLRTILDLMTQGSSTPAPSSVPSSAPVPCVDTAGKVEHNGSKRNWCNIARNANNTNKLCRNNDLFDICPVTCGRCSP